MVPFSLVAAMLLLPGLAGASGAGPSAFHSVPSAAEAGALVGSWRPRIYALASGEELPVDGRITFLPSRENRQRGEWSVVFFVTGEDGEPLRGSAEGGAWSRDGEALLLTHEYHLSAGEAAGSLPAAPVTMALRSAEEADHNHREPCEVTVEGDELTLFFPSGNSMTFLRIERLAPPD